MTPQATSGPYSYFYHDRDRFWTRTHRDEPTHMVFVVNADDTSPIYPHWQHGKQWLERYDPECDSCWLGITHSRDYHKEDINS